MVEITQDDRRLLVELDILEWLETDGRPNPQALYIIAQYHLAAEARGRIEGSKLMQEAAAKKATYYREVLAYDWASAEAADRISETIQALDPETIAKGDKT